MEIISQYGTFRLILAVVFGVYMTWGIGANDVANAMGTSVGSGAITVMQAVLIAATFEFSGAFIAGGHVTATIRKGIIDPSTIAHNPETLVFGMLAHCWRRRSGSWWPRLAAGRCPPPIPSRGPW